MNYFWEARRLSALKLSMKFGGNRNFNIILLSDFFPIMIAKNSDELWSNYAEDSDQGFS